MMRFLTITATLIAIVNLGACREDASIDKLVLDDDTTFVAVDLSDYPDWSEETHSKSTDMDYDVVFKQNELQRIDIVLSSKNWAEMQSDLSSNFSSGNDRRGGMADVDFTPVWVPCSIYFNGLEWYEVGIRYKGNSSLQSAYQSGNNKKSFKLDFDEFEDEYPALSDQRFYGFKQLNLNNNYNDASLIREKVGADLFREFGLVAAQTSFYTVYVDRGTGPQYFGVYTLVEEVDDSVLNDQLGDDSGNLYKPDGDAATFARNTYDVDEMDKKNNEELADYSDVEGLYNIINSSTRTSDFETWKSDLESIFNVDVFMKWLAANTVIQNWDTYGVMTHNYFLYNNPADSMLMWIPWDNNEAFQTGKMGGALSLSQDEVGDLWPLIRYLKDVDEYEQTYNAYLRAFVDEVFVPEKMIQLYSDYYDLLKEAAYAEESGYTYLYSDSQFDQAIETLKTHVQSRNSAVEAFLN